MSSAFQNPDVTDQTFAFRVALGQIFISCSEVLLLLVDRVVENLLCSLHRLWRYRPGYYGYDSCTTLVGARCGGIIDLWLPVGRIGWKHAEGVIWPNWRRTGCSVNAETHTSCRMFSKSFQAISSSSILNPSWGTEIYFAYCNCTKPGHLVNNRWIFS